MTTFRSRGRLDSTLKRLAAFGPFHFTVALTVAFALLLALYLVTDWLLLLLVLVAAVVGGADRLLRLHPQARFHGPTATLLYLFLPGLFAVTTALFLDQIDNVVATSVLALVTVLLFAVTVIAEYLTVDPNAETYELARFGLLLAIYVTAFAAFVVAFTAGLPLLVSVLFVAVIAFLLTVDMLRELEADADAVWIQAGAVTLVMAEVRWVLHFLSLADLLAGAFMLIVFYALTGLVQDRIAGRIDRQSWITYGALFAAGSVVILGERLFRR